MDDNLLTNLHSIWWIALAAMISPHLAAATKKHVPDVVWLLLLGVAIGPHALDLATITPGISFIKDLGLGLLFFVSGLEINPATLRDRTGRRAIRVWLVCLTLGIATGWFVTHHDLKLAVALGIAMCSTALSALIPILKETGQATTSLGQAALRHGAVGELGPLVAMTLLLSTRAPLESMALLLAFVVLAIRAVAVPSRIIKRSTVIQRTLIEGINTSAQTVLRLAVFILITLMLLSALLKLDVVLGAFVTGIMINRYLTHEQTEAFINRVQVLGFSLMIPVFFVTSGMNIDANVVVHHPGMLAEIVVLIFMIRGVPVWLAEYGNHTRVGEQSASTRDRAALGFYTAAGLPIIVAVTEVATKSGLLTDDIASTLVAAGMCTVLLFPLVASLIVSKPGPTTKTAMQ